MAVAMLLATSLMNASSAQASAIKVFLEDDGVPVASTSVTNPPAAPLPNHDPWRNADPGLTLRRSSKGFGELGPGRHQIWLVAGPVTSVDRLNLTVWSTLQNFEAGLGVLNAYLVDCDANGEDCTKLGSKQLSDAHWSGAGTWVPRTVDFGAASVGSSRRLGVKLVVDDDSDSSMWFAYGVADHPAYIGMGGASGGGDTTTTTPTTTTTVPKTTTTVPKTTTTTTETTTTTTTTTATTVPETTTTTTVPRVTTTTPSDGPTTTTTVPKVTTTTIPGGVTTTTTASSGTEPTSSSTTIPASVTSPPAVRSQAPATSSAESDEQPSEDGSDDDTAIVAADSGVDPGSGDALLAAVAVPTPVPGDTPALARVVAAPIATQIIDGSSGVLPPAVAAVLFSPLMILELLIRAITETGRAILLPALLLALVTAGAAFRDWSGRSRTAVTGA